MHPSLPSLILWCPFTAAATQQFLSTDEANRGSFWMSSFHSAWALFLLFQILFILSLLSSQAGSWQENLVPARANGFLFWVLQFDVMQILLCGWEPCHFFISSSAEFQLCFLLWAVLVLSGYTALEKTGSSRRTKSLGSIICWSAGIKSSTLSFFSPCGGQAYENTWVLPFSPKGVSLSLGRIQFHFPLCHTDATKRKERKKYCFEYLCIKLCGDLCLF